VVCLDPTSNTYSPDGDLHQASQCLYTSNDFIAAFESMSSSEWALFLLQLFSACWFTVILAGAFSFIICVARTRHQRGRAQPEHWPHIAVLIPCYMPNEQRIILETLAKVCGTTEYAGTMDVKVVYNTPTPLDIEEHLAELTSLHGRSVRCACVADSTSKAQNLMYALAHMVPKEAEIIVIFDADHHPRADTVATLVGTLIHPDSRELSATQGSVLIERGGPWPLRRIADGMEWSQWYFWAPGFSVLAGSAYFGGGNAAWRKEALTSLGFDHTMLTEDIDLTIRALLRGHTIDFVPWAQVGEMCPANYRGFYKQRLRWAMGWEQVTYRRFGTLFNSTAITEWRKWRTALLLTLRYWSIIIALIAISNMLLHTVYRLLTGHDLFHPIALSVLGVANQILTVLTLTGQFTQLALAREPWWRWCEVAAFLPVSLFYFCFQAGLIVISWFYLSCCKLEWVPTARSADDKEHALEAG
jgi:cellulose synthase/poly-beta-1,6-N-acetylglucosamine synthase-like glycosyltransferase